MRFKELTEDEMSEAQQAVLREIRAGPRGRMGLPTNILLRSPELARRSSKLGEYVRFEVSLPKRIMELAVLITAHHWYSEFEWSLHCRLAIDAGLGRQTISYIGQGKRPPAMEADEAAAYDFCVQLTRDRQVRDAAFDAALEQFGERGVVELVAVSGYFTLVAMALNANADRELPVGAAMPLPRDS